jgi:hypothetical protein
MFGAEVVALASLMSMVAGGASAFSGALIDH